MKSSFFIIADRGNVKAYRAEQPAGDRPPRMHLVQAFTLTEAHFKGTDMFTDGEGAFPTQTGAGTRQNVKGNSASERHYDIEKDRRLVKQIAQHIAAVLKQEQVEWWSLAAPSEIHDSIVEQLDPALRSRIAEHVAADLVNIPPDNLLGHFSAVRAK